MLLTWLALLPLPFGSVIARARLPLIAVPLALCALAAMLRLRATRDRANAVQPTRPWFIFFNGTLLFLLVVSLQLVPLPPALLDVLSPESAAIWRSASQVTQLAGAPVRQAFPATVDPGDTALELFRLAALFATFMTTALLVRSHARRQSLALVLCAAAVFEVVYGVREAALGRYAIWGWQNRLIFDRVTGTFVNPNHFAHYVAIVLPMALFLAATLWHRAGTPDMPRGKRLLLLFEHSPFRVGFAGLTSLICLAGILLSQSRGALLAAAAGLLFAGALLPGRRLSRTVLSASGAVVALVALVLFLGPERTVARFAGESGVQGRRVGLVTAVALWQRFSIAGSGAGTFERVVSMEQRGNLGHTYSHAHNDYAEIAATTGALGFTVAMVTLLGGYVALVRMSFGPQAADVTWSRKAFQAAALASLTIAMVHALFDFNLFIPSNPATLAAIVGASVATLDHDRRTRR